MHRSIALLTFILVSTVLFAQDSQSLEVTKETAKDSSGTRATYTIRKLTKTAPDDSYGFSPENPVLVGTGPNGGPANQRRYLDLLRDAQGKPIKYTRVASCCPYDSENGLFGVAMVDKYEITYLNQKGRKKKAFVYISFYDYEEPMILFGFQTIK